MSIKRTRRISATMSATVIAVSMVCFLLGILVPHLTAVANRRNRGIVGGKF
jgi:hypothetical protein